MSPIKQAAHGIAGCVVLPRRDEAGRLLAVTLSLVRAEPCLRRLAGLNASSFAEAQALGCRWIRSYDEAVLCGLA